MAYKGPVIREYTPDLVIEGCLIVELKCRRPLRPHAPGPMLKLPPRFRSAASPPPKFPTRKSRMPPNKTGMPSSLKAPKVVSCNYVTRLRRLRSNRWISGLFVRTGNASDHNAHGRNSSESRPGGCGEPVGHRWPVHGGGADRAGEPHQHPSAHRPTISVFLYSPLPEHSRALSGGRLRHHSLGRYDLLRPGFCPLRAPRFATEYFRRSYAVGTTNRGRSAHCHSRYIQRWFGC